MTARFGWNEHRRGLLLSFEAFLRNEIRAMFDYPVYADGSFVTDKKRPKLPSRASMRCRVGDRGSCRSLQWK